ncbi:hypothetical protein EDF72_1561 [Delftia acidovorans]|nr:hypothetical protein EDF72_1561 [Delftia acidovorans]
MDFRTYICAKTFVSVSPVGGVDRMYHIEIKKLVDVEGVAVPARAS